MTGLFLCCFSTLSFQKIPVLFQCVLILKQNWPITVFPQGDIYVEHRNFWIPNEGLVRTYLVNLTFQFQLFSSFVYREKHRKLASDPYCFPGRLLFAFSKIKAQAPGISVRHPEAFVPVIITVHISPSFLIQNSSP